MCDDQVGTERVSSEENYGNMKATFELMNDFIAIAVYSAQLLVPRVCEQGVRIASPVCRCEGRTLLRLPT